MNLLAKPDPENSLPLRQIVVGGRGGVITDWLKNEPAARAAFRNRVKYLRKMKRADWNKKQFRGLQKGVSEIKWESDKKTWRALGFDYGGYFVLLNGCTHKDGVYDPRDWLETAIRRKGEVQLGQWSVADYEP
jgi:hypothetical protein